MELACEQKDVKILEFLLSKGLNVTKMTSNAAMLLMELGQTVNYESFIATTNRFNNRIESTKKHTNNNKLSIYKLVMEWDIAITNVEALVGILFYHDDEEGHRSSSSTIHDFKATSLLTTLLNSGDLDLLTCLSSYRSYSSSIEFKLANNFGDLLSSLIEMGALHNMLSFSMLLQYQQNVPFLLQPARPSQ